jgi:hypothetical protein
MTMFPRIKIPAALARITTADLLAQPEIREIGERLAAKQLAERRTLAAQLEGVSGEAADAKCQPAVWALANAEAALVAAKAALEAAQQKRAAAQCEYGSISSQLEIRRVALERELRTGADPRLAAFDRDELEDLWERARQAFAVDVEPATRPTDTREAFDAWAATASSRELSMAHGTGDRPWVKPARPRHLISNLEGVARVMDAIRETQAAVRAAQLEALDGAEVEARIAAWREALAPVLMSVSLSFARATVTEE